MYNTSWCIKLLYINSPNPAISIQKIFDVLHYIFRANHNNIFSNKIKGGVEPHYLCDFEIHLPSH